MRKIVAGEFVSLDGVMEAPHEWHFPYWSDEMGEAVGAQMADADAMLLGRVTWQEFASFWPSQSEDEVPGTAHMNNTPKFIASTTLDNVDAWQNSTLIGGDVMARIAEMKKQPGKNIGVTGSATLVKSLLREGLLDELRLLVHPIVIGQGKRILDEAAGRVPLELVEAKTLPKGVLALTYRPDRSA